MKVNGKQYSHVLPSQHMPYAVGSFAGHKFIFSRINKWWFTSCTQHHSAAEMRERRTKTRLHHFCSVVAINSPFLNPVDYSILAVLHRRRYETGDNNVEELKTATGVDYGAAEHCSCGFWRLQEATVSLCSCTAVTLKHLY